MHYFFGKLECFSVNQGIERSVFRYETIDQLHIEGSSNLTQIFDGYGTIFFPFFQIMNRLSGYPQPVTELLHRHADR